MSRGITGEVIYVDGGYNILGRVAPGQSLEGAAQRLQGLPLPFHHRPRVPRKAAGEKRVVTLQRILKFAAGLNPKQGRICALDLRFASRAHPRLLAKTAAFFLQFKYKTIQRLSQFFGKILETIVTKTFGGNAKDHRTTIARIH